MGCDGHFPFSILFCIGDADRVRILRNGENVRRSFGLLLWEFCGCPGRRAGDADRPMRRRLRSGECGGLESLLTSSPRAAVVALVDDDAVIVGIEDFCFSISL